MAKSVHLRKRLLAVLAFATAPMILSACEQSHHARIRMTAVIEQDGVQYSASGVQEYDCRQSTHIMNDFGGCHNRGEALVIPTKSGGPLFVLFRKAMDSDGAAEAVLGAATSDPYSADNSNLPDHWRLEPSQFPLVVRFDSLKDPLSVKEVNPQDLSADFGPDARFISIDIKKTDEPLSYGSVSKVIPWINSSKNLFYIDGVEELHGISQRLSQYDFVSKDD